MNGAIYSGAVVRTTNVPTAEGSSVTVPKSEIVYTAPAPFVGFTDDMARATLLAAAIAKGIKVDDPTGLVEVRIVKY